jgi:hypothetical protein
MSVCPSWLRAATEDATRGSPKIAEGIKLGARLVAEGKLKVPIAAT